MKKRTIALLMAAVMIFGVVTGGTIAWLRADTNSVENTFTVGNINIELKEHDYIKDTNSLDDTKEVESEEDYEMVPGRSLPKDPFVRVVADSEKCWVFVTVTKSDNFDTFMTFEMDTNWTTVETNGSTAVYKYNAVVDASSKEQVLNILKDEKVVVKEEVTKTQLDVLTTDTYPTLTFKAYAVQNENLPTTYTDSQIWEIAKIADTDAALN
ncbi:MAG: hypothetical protein J6A45_05735 [Lachnospiraceae bacterium]|nr:hypothetical protein [Lachnospiraceae bacterium]